MQEFYLHRRQVQVILLYHLVKNIQSLINYLSLSFEKQKQNVLPLLELSHQLK